MMTMEQPPARSIDRKRRYSASERLCWRLTIYYRFGPLYRIISHTCSAATTTTQIHLSGRAIVFLCCAVLADGNLFVVVIPGRQKKLSSSLFRCCNSDLTGALDHGLVQRPKWLKPACLELVCEGSTTISASSARIMLDACGPFIMCLLSVCLSVSSYGSNLILLKHAPLWAQNKPLYKFHCIIPLATLNDTLPLPSQSVSPWRRIALTIIHRRAVSLVPMAMTVVKVRSIEEHWETDRN